MSGGMIYNRLLSVVCGMLEISKEDIGSSGRATKEVLRARCIIAYILKHDHLFTLKQIGDLMGGKDHSTIINVMKNVNDRIYPNIFENIGVVRDLINDMNNSYRIDNQELVPITFKYCDNQTLFGLYRLSINM